LGTVGQTGGREEWLVEGRKEGYGEVRAGYMVLKTKVCVKLEGM
jgi:hypothetical protein